MYETQLLLFNHRFCPRDPRLLSLTQIYHVLSTHMLQVSWDVYMLYMRSMGWFFVFLTFGQIFLNAALSVYSSIWLSQWTDDDIFKPQNALNYTNEQRQNAVSKYLGVYGGLGVGQSEYHITLRS